MRMTAGVRKAALTMHVTSSVGWLGAVLSFLALSIVGLTSASEPTVRAAYLAMEMVGWTVIVPLALATTPTGLVMSFGTEWGLLRHYWLVAKLGITLAATALLLLHMQPVGHLARAVLATTALEGELAGLRLQLVADAGAATVALVGATILSIYKPRGLTPFARTAKSGSRQRTWGWPRITMLVLGIALGAFVVVHLLTGGADH